MPTDGGTNWENLVTDGPASLNAAEVKPTRSSGAVQEKALEVEKVDLLPATNATEHHTLNYELVHRNPPTAVLRRGEPFSLTIAFKQRAFEPTKDTLRLHFDFGPNPLVLKGTKGIINVVESNEECWPDRTGIWDGRLPDLVAPTSGPITIQVRSPLDVPVGVWTLTVVTSVTGEEEGDPRTFTFPGPVYVLFNPWLKGDLTYMEDQKLLDEYVMNDVGKIWVGPHHSTRGRQWVFGQFEKNVLPAVMLMMEKSHMAPGSRGDPIVVSRIISKMVNTQDDEGILQGRWDGEYKDGVSPGAWTGSVEILKTYLRTKNRVKYGQCWVFAGVTTTVCRALGLPSRVVSNLVSAHDANASLTIDKYYTERGEELEFDPHNPEGEDSVWNFHVWNEVWMARRDLPKGYGGWQAIDATPQETSDGVFQCGPASLEAVKRGAVGLKYDVPFVLSSVNADLIRWQRDPTTELGFRKMDTNTRHIGRMIITKKPWIFDPRGDKDMEDVTSYYKAAEGSQMERTAMYNAVRDVDKARKFFLDRGEAKEELTFALNDLEKVPIGHNFEIIVDIQNNLDKPRTMDVVLSACSVYYNGINANLVKKASGTFRIKPQSKEQLRLTVTPDDYLEKLVEYCIMKIFAVITVRDTKQTWAGEDDFQVLKPPLEVKVPETVVVEEPFTAQFSFTNPLNKTLRNCKLRYEGPGLSKPIMLEFRDVSPMEEVSIEAKITPKRAGKLPLIGVFASRDLIDITGSANVTVVKP